MKERTERDVVVADRFRLVRSVGTDVFGELWNAIDERNGLPVCVRALDPSFCVALGSSTEVLAIARGPFAIRHANLVSLLDVVTENDRWYLVSEAYEGESLAARVARKGPLDERAARTLAANVSAALFAIHAGGAVHGRLDPSRIILGPGGAKVCDLGLGMLLGDDAEEWRTTIPDADDPTVAFLSPEQARGDGAPTPQSDIWSLAAILHFAVTGSSPYAAKSRAAQANAASTGRVSGSASSDARLSSVIRAGLAPEPMERPSLPDIVERLRARPRRTSRALVAGLTVLCGVGITQASASSVPARARWIEMTAAARYVEPAKPPIEPMSVPVVALPAPPAATPSPPRSPAKKKLVDPFYGVTSAGF